MRRRMLGRTSAGGVTPPPYDGDLLFWIRGDASSNYTDLSKTTNVSTTGDIIAVSADQSGAGRDFLGQNSVPWDDSGMIDLLGNQSAPYKELIYPVYDNSDGSNFNVANSVVMVWKASSLASGADSEFSVDIVGGKSNNAIYLRSTGRIEVFDGLTRAYTDYFVSANEVFILAVRVTSTNVEVKINDNAWQVVKSGVISGYPGTWDAIGVEFSIGSPRGDGSNFGLIEETQYSTLLTQAQTDDVIDYFNEIYSIY